MLVNYYNSAILSVKEYARGVDKLERIKGETDAAYNKRRRDYLKSLQLRKRK